MSGGAAAWCGQAQALSSVEDDVGKLTEVLARSGSSAHSHAALQAPASKGRKKRPAALAVRDHGNGGRLAAAAEGASHATPTTPTMDAVLRTVSGVVGANSSAQLAAAPIGWCPGSLAGCSLALSDDALTATATGTAGSSKYAGAVGVTRYSPGTGVHHFCIAVKDPVDDGFWVGVCYPEESCFYVDASPKANRHSVVWSGGSASPTGRPGTVRLHGEKFREQPTYSTRDTVLGMRLV